MKHAADCEPIHTIVYNHIEGTETEYVLSAEDYDRMVDELEEREAAIRRDYRDQIIALKIELKKMNRIAALMGEIGIAFADIALKFSKE